MLSMEAALCTRPALAGTAETRIKTAAGLTTTMTPCMDPKVVCMEVVCWSMTTASNTTATPAAIAHLFEPSALRRGATL